MLRQGAALVIHRRRAGVAETDAPMVPGPHQDERIQPASERFGVAAELFVNAAAALGAEENATPVSPLLQPIRFPLRTTASGSKSELRADRVPRR